VNLFIRVDCGPEIGFGHLIRCWAVGEAIAAKACSVRYITNKKSEMLVSQLPWFKGSTICIEESDLDDQLSDASSTLLAINKYVKSLQDTIVLVDSYSLGAPWRAYLIRNSVKLVLMSDTAIKPSLCDLLVNQSVAEVPTDQPDNVLVGSRYVCLHPDVVRIGETGSRSRGNTPRNTYRVLVSFGAADPVGLSIEFLKQMPEKCADTNIIFYLFPGEANRRMTEIEAVTKNYRNVRLCAPQDYIPTLVDCDLVIGSAGVSLWERIYLGIPSVVLTISSIQSKLVSDLESNLENSLIFFGGEYPNIDWPLINRFVDKGVKVGCHQPNVKSKVLVDGLGPNRIASKILEVLRARERSDLALVKLTPLKISDIFVLRKWRNNLPDESIKKNRSNIGLFDQMAWYFHLKNKNLYFILYHNGQRVGSCFLRPSANCSRAETGLLVGRENFKGSGLGLLGYYSLIVKAFYELGFNELTATVKKVNISAIKMNKFFGFHILDEDKEFLSLLLRKDDFAKNDHLHAFMAEVRYE
jgi:UDP-2,4-diacetamido-2,4,6-trideoxy-beta-L-altropyranose hydrolase